MLPLMGDMKTDQVGSHQIVPIKGFALGEDPSTLPSTCWEANRRSSSLSAISIVWFLPDPLGWRRKTSSCCPIVRRDGGASAYRSMQQRRGFPLDGTTETAGADLPLHRRRGGR